MQELRNLAGYALARLMTFNARRGGECSKLKLCHWEGINDGRWKRRTDMDNLEGIEKKLAERMEVCYVEGKKKGKSLKKALVPILFTSEVIMAIRYLVEHRKLLGVPPTNKYVFAAGQSYLGGWNTL